MENIDQNMIENIRLCDLFNEKLFFEDINEWDDFCNKLDLIE